MANQLAPNEVSVFGVEGFWDIYPTFQSDFKAKVGFTESFSQMFWDLEQKIRSDFQEQYPDSVIQDIEFSIGCRKGQIQVDITIYNKKSQEHNVESWYL